MKKSQYINREISWLSFNDRVLQEAADPSVPLVERIKFLGIFSNNRDEFFRVRVATLKRMVGLGKPVKEVIGGKPEKILAKIHEVVVAQQANFEKIYKSIIKELEKENIFLVNEAQLNREQGEFVGNYFTTQVRPRLVPVMLNYVKKFPYLKDKAIYLAVKLVKEDQKPQLALIEVPSNVLPRFLVLPSIGEKQFIMILDDVIRYCLPEIFAVFDYDKIEAHTIKITRDAELDMDQDLTKSIFEKISKSVKRRYIGEPVRFVYDQNIPEDVLEFIKRKMRLKDTDNLIPGGRYHNFKDFMKFPNVGSDKLQYAPAPPLESRYFHHNESIMDVMKERDVLLHYPYQSFTYMIDLLREAAIDPQVTEIKMTLYRVASESNVINALINAAKNGKSVTVVMEIRARFDEEANIYWANKMQEEGVKVIFGVPGLKVHSKLCLITRKENGKAIKYANITTGNYNEVTATLYSDFSYFTADKQIALEVNKIFNFLEINYKVGEYKQLIVSPLYMRKKFYRLINNEIKNAQEGKAAYIHIKLNNLVDREMIRKLYEASQAGVKIKIIARSTCSLIPGMEGFSENIEAISIVDRFLEHARLYFFCNGGNELCYISSADLMTRNLDSRVEVTCPIQEKEIFNRLKNIWNIQWSDNVKARMLDKKQANKYRKTSGKKVRAQAATYEYLKKVVGEKN